MATPEAAAEMMKMIEQLRLQVTDLNSRLVKAEEDARQLKAQGESTKDEDKAEKTKKEIKGYDVKHMQRPELYDGKPAS